MSRAYFRINRFGFAEYEDMVELARTVDVSRLRSVLSSVVELVLSEESDLFESLTDGAQADFAVPLGMCAHMLSADEYSVLELVAAACTVRYCAEPHLSEFPGDLVQLLAELSA